jgi:hypothetical protein
MPQRQRGPNPRLVALALAVVAGIGLAAVITAMTGDESPTGAASAAPVSQSIATTTTQPPTTTTTIPTTTTTIPTTTTLAPVTANRVFVLGDSVLLGAVNEIPPALPGWQVIVDAKVSRFLNQGTEVMQARRAEIGDGGVVIIQQGNNYLGSAPQFREHIDQAMAVLAGVPKVVWITVAEFTPSRADVNREILAAAQRYPNIVLADWNGVWRTNPRGFASRDGLHLTRPGAAAFAAMIAQAVGPPPA